MTAPLKDIFTSFVFENRHELVGILGIVSLLVLWMNIRIIPIDINGYYSTLIHAIAGTMLIFSGVGLRLWAGLYIGGYKNSALITDGPYSLIRNPLYLGNMISALGVMLMTQSLVAMLIVMVGLPVIYTSTISHEEKKLLKLFGHDYANYIQSTPRMIPCLKALRVLLAGAGSGDHISYRNLARELKRGVIFVITGLLVLVGSIVMH